MKAVAFEKVGGPEVLQLRETEKPVPQAGEVVVRVKACALNLLDYYLRIEEDPEMPMPHIMGSDISGTVDTLGPGVAGWKSGDEVLVAAAIERPGDRPQIIGYQTQGGYAEFACVPARNLIPKPSRLSFEEAASMPLVFATAYHQLIANGELRPGESALVMGGSGGIGTAAIQLCRAVGAFVIATVGSDEKKQAVKDLGADLVVNHNSPDWEKEVLRLTGGRGVDVVCEHMGGAYTAQCVAVAAHGGRVVTIGSTTGSELKLNLNDVFRREISVRGSYMGSTEELRIAVRLAEWGRVQPTIARIFPLEQAREAHLFLESRKHIGKIVLKIL